MIMHDCPPDGSWHDNSTDCPCRPVRQPIDDESNGVLRYRHRSRAEQRDVEANR